MNPDFNLFRARRATLSALIFFFTILAYFTALANGFVYDDNFVVMDNPLIKGGAPIGDIFFKNVWSFFADDIKANFYRPLQLLIYRFEFALFDLRPGPWHLVNILFHAVNSALVFLLVSTLLSAKEEDGQAKETGGVSTLLPPIVSALVFALHPVNVEPVAWVSSLSDPLFTFFFLLAFLLFITGEERSMKSPRFLVVVILFFLALLGKETAMALIPVIFLYGLARERGLKIERLLGLIPFIFAAAIYMILRTYALGAIAQKETVDMGAHAALINIFPLFTAYIAKLVLPINLSVIYTLDYVSAVSDPAFFLPLIITIAFLVLIFLFRKRPAPFTALALIAVPLLPVLYIPVVSTGGFSERYLYLPTVGFALLLGYLFKWGINEITQRHAKFGSARVRLFNRLLIISFALLLISYSLGSVQRIGVWKDDLTLWLDAVENSPKSAIAHYNLGTLYQDKKSYPEAIWHYQNAARLDPSSAVAFFNLGSIFAESGLYPDAADFFERAVRLDPERYEFRLSLAKVFLAGGSPDRAVGVLDELLRLSPGNAPALELKEQVKKTGG